MKKNVFYLTSLCICLGISLAGCEDIPSGTVTYFGCDPDCGTGQICQNGVCVDQCNPACTDGKICKNGECVDPDVCNPTCTDGKICQNGVCVDLCDPECTGGLVCKNGTCVDPNACDPECLDNQVCEKGECVPKPICGVNQVQIASHCVDGNTCNPSCQTGEICVNGICLKGDDSSCDPACDENEVCIGGKCVHGSTCVPDCADDEVCIYGVCVKGDDSTCDPSCKDNEICLGGTCVHGTTCSPVCAGDLVCVNGECVKTGDAPCDPACTNNQVCVNGICVPNGQCPLPCQMNEICIDGLCVKDDDSCSPACENDQICLNGQCVGNTCNQTCVSGLCLNGTCVPSDPSGCTPECANDEICVGGTCVNNGTCRPVCSGSDVCANDTCVPGIFDCDPACTTGYVCKDGKCVDPNDCYPECKENEVCEEGICVPKQTCGVNQVLISSYCVDGNTCNPSCQTGEICVNGNCLKSDDSSCDPACDENEVCIGDKCVHGSTCVPDCADDEVCIYGVCVKGDDSTCNTACKDNEICLDGACVHGTTCSPACAGDLVCVNGECVETGDAPCDPACTNNQVCVNGVCVPGGQCPDYCQSNEICIDGLCVKGDDTCSPTCDDGQICLNGQCVGNTCNQTCVSGLCINGSCLPITPSTCSSECEDGEICIAGTCINNGTCSPSCSGSRVCANDTCVPGVFDCDPACAVGLVCVDGECVDPNACNPECNENQQCIKGTCVDKVEPCDPACENDQVCFHNRCIDPDPTCTNCIYPSVCINGVCHDPGCPPACVAPAHCINGACIDPKTDCEDKCESAQMCVAYTPAECGDPGSVCTPECEEKSCFLGICTDPGTECNPECSAPQICINGKCEDPNTCVEECKAPEICINGKCADPNFCDPECTENQLCIEGVCKDLDKICDPECAPDEMCVNNKCIPTGSCNPECVLPEVCINGTCMDPAKCDPGCSPNQICVNGICVDPKPVCTPKCIEGEYCAYDYCHNPGHLCTPRCKNGQACFNNQCIDEVITGDCADASGKSACSKSEICINGACVDPGKCDKECENGEICVNGRCIDPNFCAPACTGSQVCIQGECVDPDTPACSETCKEGQICVNGTCIDTQCPENQVFSDGKCVAPTTVCTPECPTGEVCVNNICKKDCGTKARCGVDEDICCADDEICVNPICVPKGNSCETLNDCGFYEYCDPETKSCVNADDVSGICEVKPAVDDFSMKLKFHWPNCLGAPDATHPEGVNPNAGKGKAERWERVITTPLAAPFDTNGDGKINDQDQTVIAFIGYRNDTSPDNANKFTNNYDKVKARIHFVVANKSSEAEAGTAPKCIEIATTEPNYFSYPISMAIADIDNDGLPEVVAGTKDKTSPKLHALGLNKTENGFEIVEKYSLPLKTAERKTVFPSVAYLDPKNDKYPSILLGYGVTMIDDSTGEKKLVWREGCSEGALDNTTVLMNAANLDDDPDGVMEIVGPSGIYDSNCNQLLSDKPEYFKGNIAIADLMPSGNDAATTGELVPELAHVISGDKGGKFVFTKVFKKDGKWSVKKAWENEIPIDAKRAQNLGKSTLSGGGHPVIANFDGSPYPGIGVASRYYYIVYGNDGTPDGGHVLWADATTQDYSSAVTGSSVFDFNGDGKAEVVYSDETTLHIYEGAGSGSDGSDTDKYNDQKLIVSAENYSATGNEYPIIADIDDDGSTEIVVASDCNKELCPTIATKTNARDTLGINVYESSGEKWLRSRHIWNQHQYHITNINEDGTVPQKEVENWLDPKLNNFRQNVQPSGVNNAADLTSRSLSLNPVNCPTFIHLTALIRNIGTLSASNAISIKFFVRNYNNTGHDAFIGETGMSAIIHAGEDLSVKYTWVDRKGTDVQTGETIPAISLPAEIYYYIDEPYENHDNGDVTECDEANNASVVYTLSENCTLSKI